MATEKEPTIKHMKEKRSVPEHAKTRSKEFARIKKTILTALKSGPRAIPDIAQETGLPSWQVTYYLMSLRKYGEIEETQEINDNDYYLYVLKDKGR